MKKRKIGNSHNSFGGRGQKALVTLDEWMLDEKRFEERLHYYRGSNIAAQSLALVAMR